jgi:hypothetical protein
MHSDEQKVLIRRHLTKVLSSSEFARSGKASSFLEFVVGYALDDSVEPLKERAIAVAVFDKANDRDPKLDTCVRTEARRVRKKLSEYYASQPLMNKG